LETEGLIKILEVTLMKGGRVDVCLCTFVVGLGPLVVRDVAG